jgi:hypothetical protein
MMMMMISPVLRGLSSDPSVPGARSPTPLAAATPYSSFAPAAQPGQHPLTASNSNLRDGRPRSTGDRPPRGTRHARQAGSVNPAGPHDLVRRPAGSLDGGMLHSCRYWRIIASGRGRLACSPCPPWPLRTAVSESAAIRVWLAGAAAILGGEGSNVAELFGNVSSHGPRGGLEDSRVELGIAYKKNRSYMLIYCLLFVPYNLCLALALNVGFDLVPSKLLDFLSPKKLSCTYISNKTYGVMMNKNH